MRLSIFARLIISYLMLSCMLAGVSLYFIYQLGRFSQATRSLVLNDTVISEYSSQISETLLSESRYERKYVVLKDEEVYASYIKAKEEFDQLLAESLRKTTSEKIKNLFLVVSQQHKKFGRLVNEERELIKIAKPYPSKKFAEEKKKVADDIIEQLQTIRLTNEKKLFAEIADLSNQGEKSLNLSIIISIFVLSAGLLVAFFITRSIKKPLDVMRAKTVEISQGNFKEDLDIESPSEITELADSINTMCHKLQEVDDIKSGFFSHMSHELRTPLASIKEGTSMLLEGLGGEISEKQQRILKIIVHESNRLIGLVNSLLDLSKMEAGMQNYKFAPADIGVLVKKNVESLESLAEAKNISIESSIGVLQPVKVDKEKLQQVFNNLIGNAIKFTPENGKIKLEAYERGNFIEVAVHDNGIGIPEEDIERIFLKFQQVMPAKGEKIKGTGLGLATVKQIILAHGGKVWATSQLGLGSTFYISLPFAA